MAERLRKRRRRSADSGWGGVRPGAGRPRSGEPPILLANRLARIEERLSDLAGLYAKAATIQTTQFESLPAILRRLTEMERKMGLRERITTPRFDRVGNERPSAREPMRPDTAQSVQSPNRLTLTAQRAEDIFKR
jgi:hypothetical protein